MIKKMTNYFTKFEIGLWCVSVLLIASSFFIFGESEIITLVASIVGVTSLIFIAKGNPFGQVLMVCFCCLYGYISFSCAYYGEMITYMGMSAPMAIFSMISWLRNPYKGNKAQVTINHLSKAEIIIMCLLTSVVTVSFFFILQILGTANLPISTISVTTSFLAVFLSFRRSPFFALGYAANDIVLITLWTIASISDISYLSVVICFVVFLANDCYSFVNWTKMKKKQSGI